MRHATVNATRVLFDWVRLGSPETDRWQTSDRRACGWEKVERRRWPGFSDGSAIDLNGGLKVALPTCPACAALVDLALEMRGSA